MEMGFSSSRSLGPSCIALDTPVPSAESVCGASVFLSGLFENVPKEEVLVSRTRILKGLRAGRG